MCGIVGIIGQKAVATDLVDALRRLEYRGYDSAGIATVENGHLERRRAEGKLRNLEGRLLQEPLKGHTGIGHTRWATHGRPTERNAHPHMNGQVSVVHNGIIENFRELKAELSAKGHVFESDTDTEAIVHVVADELSKGVGPEEAVRQALGRLQGAFALAIIFAGHDDLMIAARQGSPLAIGHGTGEMYLGSDAIALAPFTDAITYLDEGDWAVLRRDGVEIFDRSGKRVERPQIKSVASSLLVDKGNHRHFMAKEIHEQPEVISHTLANYIDMAEATVTIPDLGVDPATPAARHDVGVRHRLLRGSRRQVLDRALRAPAGRDRRRLRDALPRAAAGQGRPVAVRLPVGRDRRHARRAAPRQGRSAAHRRRRQRAHLIDRARIRHRAADARRS